ncbi:hypothetical protein FOPE_08318 [Fonsecaea pedrosoi]|nr:hypothetical protein FOPE_08318 [Fonsecaea pedrosoi]
MTVDTEKAAPEMEVPVIDGRKNSLRAGSIDDITVLDRLGYKPELNRNRSMATLLFQSLAIAAIPYGEGGPFISAIYGGGPLAIFVGWIVVLVLDECIALSLGELASRYPTSAGPYYWSFQLASRGKTTLSFITGWTWLIGNWTISKYLAFLSMPLSCFNSLVFLYQRTGRGEEEVRQLESCECARSKNVSYGLGILRRLVGTSLKASHIPIAVQETVNVHLDQVESPRY